MNWKDKLKILEQNEDFDVAIFFMKKIIQEYPDDVDAYIFILFRLMYTIVEGSCYFSNISESKVGDVKQQYYDTKDTEYTILALKYFNAGFAKFSENADFLYYVGTTAAMSEWYFGIDRKDYELMLEKAILIDPKNMTYRWLYYYDISRASPKNTAVLEYVQMLFEKDSAIKKQLDDKGAVGKYVLGMMMNWAGRIMPGGSA